MTTIPEVTHERPPGRHATRPLIQPQDLPQECQPQEHYPLAGGVAQLDPSKTGPCRICGELAPLVVNDYDIEPYFLHPVEKQEDCIKRDREKSAAARGEAAENDEAKPDTPALVAAKDAQDAPSRPVKPTPTKHAVRATTRSRPSRARKALMEDKGREVPMIAAGGPVGPSADQGETDGAA